MDCKYLIKVPPLTIEEAGDTYWTLRGYHTWLEENNIKKYRGGEWPRETDRYLGENVSFRFESKEDAVAFKLRWV